MLRYGLAGTHQTASAPASGSSASTASVGSHARGAVVVAMLLALPAVNGAGLLVQNSAALIFPGWVRLGLVRPSGVEAMGQSILTTFGSAIGMLALLALPAAAAIAVTVALFPTVGPWALPLAAALGALLLGGELWMITSRLGRVFDRTEPMDVETAD